MRILKKEGFTLVELIVVITILAILGSIAFISLEGYTKQVRDSTRISDIANFKKGVEIFVTETGEYPLPDNSVKLTSGMYGTVTHEGETGEMVSHISRLSDGVGDPLTGEYFGYSVSGNKKSYQVKYSLEEDEYSMLPNAHANFEETIVEGNYNGLYSISDKGAKIALPSLFSGIVEDSEADLTSSSFDFTLKGKESEVEFTPILLDETDKTSFITDLQTAYSGTPELQDNPVIKKITNVDLGDSSAIEVLYNEVTSSTEVSENNISCEAGFHEESLECIANTQSCVISNGTGEQNWDSGSSSWGACSPVSCNSGYTNVGGACINLPQFIKVEAGSSHTCGITTLGGLKCWGSNANGQIGNGVFGGNVLTPTKVSGLTSGVSDVSLGGNHTCAVLTSGGVKCWGNNSNGQIGNLSTSSGVTLPTNVSGLTSGVSGISLGSSHTCAVLTNGGVKCWGYNAHGQIGNGSTSTRVLTPTNVSGLTSGVSGISLGSSHTCALLTNGGVKCWGWNSNGQIGNGFAGGNVLTPTNVSGLTSGVSGISLGSSHTCALLTNGGVKCWGWNSNGQIGNGFAGGNVLSPTNVSGLTSGVSGISLGISHTCARLTNGGVKCWGGNQHGQIGNLSTSSGVPSPTNVSGLTSGVSGISLGNIHTCVRLTNSGVKCWGYNGQGQIGNGNSGGSVLSPTNVIQ